MYAGLQGATGLTGLTGVFLYVFTSDPILPIVASIAVGSPGIYPVGGRTEMNASGCVHMVASRLKYLLASRSALWSPKCHPGPLLPSS